MRGIQGFPCGKCLPCLVKRRRLWASRLVLESFTSAASYFITLTYSPENYPPNGSLQPEVTQRFLKRFRRKMEPCKVRYFMVGEYGDQSARPHYHAAIFLDVAESQSYVQTVCDESWGLGFSVVGQLTPQSAAYTAGYVTKKLVSLEPSFLAGRAKEFARMSLRPGIGRKAMESVATVLGTEIGLDHISRQEGAMPTYLKMGSKSLVLGRYLRRQLNGLLGMSEKIPSAQNAFLLKSYNEMAEALKAVTDPTSKVYGLPIVQALLTKDEQSVRNMTARLKLKDGVKKL